MKIFLAALAVGFALAAAVAPALAAEPGASGPVATGKPTALVQKAADRAKRTKKDVRAKAGQSAHGDVRSEAVKAVSQGKPQ